MMRLLHAGDLITHLDVLHAEVAVLEHLHQGVAHGAGGTENDDGCRREGGGAGEQGAGVSGSEGGANARVAAVAAAGQRAWDDARGCCVVARDAVSEAYSSCWWPWLL